MRSTWMADQAARTHARFTVTRTGADGEPQEIVLDTHTEIAVLETSVTKHTDRRKAWKLDPKCFVCGALIEAPERCGVFHLERGSRVACKGHCVAAASKITAAEILARNPKLQSPKGLASAWLETIDDEEAFG